ncbi:MAG: glycine--tRNA ligase subunit beta, partial [Kofleriaceae bacterium]|nr:glycine--tRNA ligase subunit beta [Kofleriaceae bacterium]
MADTQDLLFEIGTEEVPARMLARALAELPAQATAALAAARLTHGDVRVVGAPRRLALLVSALATRQPDLRERVVGPPAGAAFRDGAPTQAAIGFAQKNGVDPSALTLSEVAGKKGQYVVAERFVAGGDTRALLPDLLLGLLTGIAWPKSMRWGWADEAFVRPVQWMVALLGAEVVPVRWRGVEAGRVSRGHRFLAPGPVELAAPADYEAALRRAHVVVDPRLRRELIAAELTRVERDTGLRVRPDDELLAEVTNLVEYPVAIVGEFDRSFLEVPAEIIVTAMRTHQRYFALEDAAGALANRFVTIAGTIVRDPAQVVAGNARVLAARLADAKFFFAEDRK